MYCRECGIKLMEGQDYCPNCGTKVEEENPEPAVQLEQGTSSNTKPINRKKVFIIAAVVLTILSIIIVVSVILFQNQRGQYKKYLEENPINQSAVNVDYQCVDEGKVEDFSCDLSTPAVISNQIYDIDNDGIKELLQITIERDEERIYPSLTIIKETEKSTTTTHYSFESAKFYISTIFEGNYYLYKSNQNTFVLFEKDKPMETSQYYAAGVLGEEDGSTHSYYFIDYDDGHQECFDIYQEELLLNTNDYSINNDSAVSEETQKALQDSYNLTQMSNLRTTFSLLGLKGFLTGTDDIENIMNYNDITPIGKFSVTINGYQGHISYTDMTKAEE